jgi:hypothetical protein
LSEFADSISTPSVPRRRCCRAIQSSGPLESEDTIYRLVSAIIPWHMTKGGAQETDIFFDAAVISREALMVRSRRSWCSSNSARKVSNMGRKGDCWAEGASIVSDLGRFWPICCCCVVCLDFFLCCFCLRELLVMSLEGRAWRSRAGCLCSAFGSKRLLLFFQQPL